MSRRASRDSHSKRLHSRSEREPSPKKSRRDKKQATRTNSRSHHVDVDTLDRNQKQQRRLQDALPLEIPPEMESKVQHETIKVCVDKKADGLLNGTKYSSDPPQIPRSRSYSQHDERGSAEHGGRSSARRGTDHSRWSDPKEHSSERFRDKVESQQPHADDSNAWRHDGFFELETEAPPARKRPAFWEKKIEAPQETAAAAIGSEATRVPAARREERVHYSCGFENKPVRPPHRADERSFRRGDRCFQRGDTQRGGYQSRERFGGGETRGRDRFNGRYGESSTDRPGRFQAEKWKHDLFDDANRDRFNGRYGESSTDRPGRFQAEKWKHDLFDDANRSPPPMNEEEQIAKVEALLAQ